MSSASNLEILDASLAAARARWMTLWEASPDREVFANPDYAQLFCRKGELHACLAWCDAGGTVLFPLILRPMATEPWASDYISDLWDATTPYGYGGAQVWGEPDGDGFWRAFEEWARSRKLVSLFVRLSLFPGAILPFPGDVIEVRPNVVRSLALAPDAMWMDYEHKVRKNTKRAQREGVRVEVDLEGLRIDDFLSVYYSTMERRAASSAYYFDREFFLRLIRDLRGYFAFFHALHDGNVVSSELVLESSTHIYSFLGGTKAEAFDLRPNDLLKHEIIRWGSRAGKDAFILGGGYGSQDGILRYKLSFAPNGIVPFRVGQRIFDRDAYDRLVSQRGTWEARQGRQWKCRGDFFPAYRG
jgi:hypothetical protein